MALGLTLPMPKGRGSVKWTGQQKLSITHKCFLSVHSAFAKLPLLRFAVGGEFFGNSIDFLHEQ